MALLGLALAVVAVTEAVLFRVRLRARRSQQELAEAHRRHEAVVAELRSTSDFLEKAQKAANIGSYRHDVASDRWIGSAQLDEIFGIDAAYVRDQKGWLALVVPEQREEMAAYLESVLTERRRFDKEYRVLRRSDGGERWVVGTGELELDARGAVVAMIGTIRDVTARRLAENALSASDAQRRLLAQAVEQAAESVVITDTRPAILYVNPAFTRATGYSREEVIGKNPSLLKSGRHDARFYALLWAELGARRTWSGRMNNRRKDGTFYEEESSIAPVTAADGRVTHYIAVKRDVSRERSLEAQLLHAQKLESIGRLAGGVAHDFNNILTAINGYAQFVMDALPAGDAKRGDVDEILKAGARAVALTRQLLAFSRRQIIAPKILDIGALAAATAKMLKRLIGEDIELELRLPSQPCWALVDAGQIDQVLMNLAVNARDAMPGRGTLTISVEEARRPAQWHRERKRAEGPLVLLRVADTGSGMTEEVRARIFEPFFTTKEQGKGTGLGLSTVYGIVKQSGGEIEVDSAPGAGTAFSIYFPQVAAVSPAQSGPALPGARGGGEMILLVEDEEPLRRMTERMLRGLGYGVIACADGDAALVALRGAGAGAALLLTDVVLPGMNGRELARRVTRQAPGLRTLYMSGYSENAVSRGGVLDPGLALIEKPFTREALAAKIRATLNSSADQARA